MNELDEICAWLNGERDFDRGMMLYIAYINEPVMRSHLNNSRNAEKLFEIMRKRFSSLKERVIRPSLEGAAKPLSKAGGGGNVVKEAKQPTKTELPAGNATDDILEPLKEQWGQLKLEMQTWHTELFLIAEQNPTLNESHRKQRAGLAEKILANESQLQKLSLAFDHARLYGKLPDGFVAEGNKRQLSNLISAQMTDTEKVLLLKNSVNPNISKLKNKIAAKRGELSALIGKDLDKASVKIAAWEIQLAQLESQKNELLTINAFE